MARDLDQEEEVREEVKEEVQAMDDGRSDNLADLLGKMVLGEQDSDHGDELSKLMSRLSVQGLGDEDVGTLVEGLKVEVFNVDEVSAMGLHGCVCVCVGVCGSATISTSVEHARQDVATLCDGEPGHPEILAPCNLPTRTPPLPVTRDIHPPPSAFVPFVLLRLPHRRKSTPGDLSAGLRCRSGTKKAKYASTSSPTSSAMCPMARCPTVCRLRSTSAAKSSRRTAPPSAIAISCWSLSSLSNARRCHMSRQTTASTATTTGLCASLSASPDLNTLRHRFCLLYTTTA